jgi:hypothetical protein
MPVTPTKTTRARDNTEKGHVFMFNAASALLSVEFAVRSVSLSCPAADITFWQCHCFSKSSPPSVCKLCHMVIKHIYQ